MATKRIACECEVNERGCSAKYAKLTQQTRDNPPKQLEGPILKAKLDSLYGHFSPYTSLNYLGDVDEEVTVIGKLIFMSESVQGEEIVFQFGDHSGTNMMLICNDEGNRNRLSRLFNEGKRWLYMNNVEVGFNSCHDHIQMNTRDDTHLSITPYTYIFPLENHTLKNIPLYNWKFQSGPKVPDSKYFDTFGLIKHISTYCQAGCTLHIVDYRNNLIQVRCLFDVIKDTGLKPGQVVNAKCVLKNTTLNMFVVSHPEYLVKGDWNENTRFIKTSR